MQEQITRLSDELEGANATTKDSLESFRLKFIGKKGVVSRLFEEFKGLPAEEKKKVGQALNELKKRAEARYKELQGQLVGKASQKEVDIDLSLPPVGNAVGNLH
ncbi:MAG: phenylalanine--tRNA ligase subunit alpha, partial [Cyclobacteriaceae bacterium]|nr:phenylalanine--tRNA ligase subunit alpha [Cyclobacteriaceae bacterium]